MRVMLRPPLTITTLLTLMLARWAVPLRRCRGYMVVPTPSHSPRHRRPTLPRRRRPTFFSSTVSSSSSAVFSSTTAPSTEEGGKKKNIVGTPATACDDGVRPYEITTPIYYVNDKPHIGHAYTSTACDVLARFMRLSGRDVFFVSGTDEHGQKVEQSAAKEGIPPQDFVDNVSENFRELLDLLDITQDRFIRTTEPDHKTAAQQFWQVLVDKGYIYKGTYSGWYSVRDECFYNESELDEDGNAPTGAAVDWVAKEDSYFFKLSAFEEKLLTFYKENPEWIAPPSRRKEVMNFVEGGLRDLSVSRTSFDWGIPVPDDPDHIMYVWIDALTNYLSAIQYPGPDDDNENHLYPKFWPAALHVVGKDILRFHAVYWPAFLMAADLPLPGRVFAHGWWTKDGEKISKSLGNTIDPVELVHTYGVDQTRFFLMAEVNFGSDGDFSESALILRVNNNLANELGNLCQRTLSMVYKNCNQAVPTDIGPFTPDDEVVLTALRGLHGRCATAISEQAIQKYVQELITMVWDGNKYIDRMEPWVLRKTDPARMATVLYVILELLRHVAILYQPVMPGSANTILDLLAVPDDHRAFEHVAAIDVAEGEEEEDVLGPYTIQPGTPIGKPEGVFPRIDMPEEQVAS